MALTNKDTYLTNKQQMLLCSVLGAELTANAIRKKLLEPIQKEDETSANKLIQIAYRQAINECLIVANELKLLAIKE